MTIDAQRIHKKADRIREERRNRPTTRAYDAERDGEVDADDIGAGQLAENPDDGATLAPTPVDDPTDRIARTEGVSTFRSTDDMRGLGDPAGPGFAEAVSDLGRDLASQVDTRVQDWLDEAEETINSKVESLDSQKPQGFIYGALFGGLILALGVLLGSRTQNR